MKTSQAQLRASVIMRVQKGEITATEGARLLGVSRKTYYQWEKRGLSGLLSGVSELEPGRPASRSTRRRRRCSGRWWNWKAALNQAKEVEAVRLVLLDMAKIRDRKERSKNSKRSNVSDGRNMTLGCLGPFPRRLELIGA